MKTYTFFQRKTWAIMKSFLAFLVLLAITANYSAWGQTTITIGTGTANSPSNTVTPYSTSYMDGRHQFLILASEITAAGGQAGTITQFGLQIFSVSAQPMNGFTISMKQTAVSVLTTTYETGLTTVYSNTAYTPAGTGWQMLPLSLPFAWNGTSNILVQICFDNTSYTSSSSVYYSTTATNLHHYGYADSETGCTMTAPSFNGINLNRANMRLYFDCTSPAGMTSSTAYYLTNVTTTGGTTNINNTSTYAAGGYSNYYSGAYCTATPGSVINITLTTNQLDHYYYIWIDYNNDGDYLDADETVLATTGYTVGYTKTYTVPATMAPGTYRMRVANSYTGTLTPCGPAPFGEYEDYKFVVCTCPTNETCAGATYISYYNSSYTTSGVLGCFDDCTGGAYNDVFYRFNPQATGSYTVDMGNSYGDTYMRVYSGSCCTGTLVATGDDEFDGTDPQITLTLTAGTNYYFECGSYSSSTSMANAAYNLHLVRNCNSILLNETCAGASYIPGYISSYSISGILGCSDDCAGVPYSDVFYYFTPHASGSYTIDMGLSEGDTYIKIYSGSCCSGTLVASGDQEYGGGDPSVTVTLTGGTTYYFECGSWSGGMENAAYYLNVVRNCPTAPANETCAGAIGISNGSLPYSNSSLLGCTNDCAGLPNFDVFYSFTPIYSGSYTADMIGSQGDSYMKVYAGTCCTGTLVATGNQEVGDDASVTLTLTGGTTYYFECGSWYPTGYANAPYNFHLARNCAPQTNETCATPTIINSFISTYSITDTLGCTDDCAATPYYDVFYSFTPQVTGSYTADMHLSQGDTYMKLRSGSCCGTVLASNDDGAGDMDPQITYTLIGGTTYYFELGSLSGSEYMSNTIFNFNLVRNCTAPSNETCAGATNIPNSSTPYSTSGLLGCTDDCTGYPRFDVFYSFTPLVTGSYTADMYLSAGDTYMKLFSGSCCGTLEADNDDGAGDMDPKITYTLIGGTTYYFECGSWYSTGYSNAAFNFNLVRNCTTPANETCAGATNISFAQIAAGYNTSGTLGCTNDCAGYPYHDVFFRYDCTKTGIYTFDMRNSDGNTEMRIFSGSCCGTQIAYDDDSYGGSDPSITVTMIAGTSYWIECGNYSNYDYYTGTAYNLYASYRPWNDDCSAVTPEALSVGSTLTFSGNNTNATTDCPLIAWATVWHAFTTTECADVVVDFCSTSPAFDPVGIVLTQCTCSSLTYSNNYDSTECGNGNWKVYFNNLPAGTYYYPVYSNSPSIGPYTMHITANYPTAIPTAVTATPALILCGNGSSELNATSVGNNINWYTVATGGTPFASTASGVNLQVSPSTNTTYYAEASAGGNNNTITTLFTSNNSNYGAMFDVNVLQNITVSSFDVNLTTGQTADVAVYYKTASFVGFENNPAAWTLIGTAANILSNGTNVSTPLNLNLNLHLTAGQTYAFYITTTDGTLLPYTNGTAVGNIYSSNSDIQIEEGVGKAYPFGSTATPRIWNGNIQYISGACVSARTPVTVTVTSVPTAPTPVTATPSTICSGATSQLNATSVGNAIDWYTVATGGTALGTSNSGVNYPVSPTTTTTYYAEAEATHSSTVGPLKPENTGTVASSTINNQYLIFDVANRPGKIVSVDIFPTAPIGSAFSINILNSSGTQIFTTGSLTTTVTGGAKQTVPINFTVPAGTAYRMQMGINPGLNRNNAGAVYPYTNGNISITGNSFPISGFYYYCYNWQIEAACSSTRTPVTLTVNPANTIELTAGGTQTKCINTAITTTTYATTGATGATVTGLPTGVTGSWAANVVTISGTPAVSGTFTYTVTLTGGCGTGTAIGTITVNPVNTIILTAGGTQTKCINTAITTTTYATTGATGATVTGLPTGVTGSWAANVVTINGASTVSGTFTYTVTLTGGCGTVTATGTITVNPVNTIILTAGGSQTKCINTAITTTTYATTGATGAIVTGLPTGVTGSWAANVVTISGTPSVSGIFTYLINLTGGCGTAGTSGTIIVIPANTITLTAGGTQTKCINTAITTTTYATTGATGATVTGLPTGVTGSWAANVVTISGTPSVTGTFTYTVTLTGGCGTGTATGTITVTPVNTIELTAGGTQTKCINTAITTTTYATTGATGATVTGLPTGVTGSWAANVVTINGTPSVSGTFTYTVTLTGGCGTVTATGTITVTPANTIELTAGGTQTKCINTAITTTTYATTGATGAIVTGLPTGVTGSWAANVVTISGTPSVSGTFTYTVTLTGGCGAITATGTITVNPANTIELTAGGTQTKCINTAITTTTYATTGATGATVTGLPTGVTASWAADVVTINGTPSVSGVFTYTVTLTGGCGTVTTTGTITVTPVNTITLTAGGTQTKCINTAITTTTYTTTGATGATVTGLPTGVTASWAANVVTISGTPSVSGVYTYTVTLTGGCGTVTATGTITVTPANTIELTAGGTQTKCINTAITTTTYATTGATGATVTGLPTGVTGSWAANVVTISGTPAVSGTFTYTVTLTGGCGTGTATGTITVTPVNTITLTAGGTQTKCINTAITTTTYATTGATGAIVTGLPTGVTGSWAANVVTISGTPAVSGTFTYTVTLTGGCGTGTATGTITVTPVNTITLTAGGTQTKCINTAITTTTYTTTGATGATVTGLPTGVTGNWAANVVTISGTPLVSGTFTYTVTLTGGCGNIATTGTITVTPANTITLTADDNQIRCINTAITTITYATTGATGATVTGLPTGVTASWAADVVTINGTPSVSGVFTYTVTLTGGCGTVTTTGTITVKPVNTITLTAGGTQTIFINTAITNTTYATTGATGATVTGLPTGVTGSWAADVVTISGTPSVSGTFTYTVTLTGGCGTVTATGTITVNTVSEKSMAVKLYLEGLYAGGGLMNQAQNTSGSQFPAGIADTVCFELHNSTLPYGIFYEEHNVELHTDGTLLITHLPGSTSGSFYITIKHRNSIETWSALPYNLSGAGPFSYDFTTNFSKAFGGNQIEVVPNVFAIYSGDVNQDGLVDGSDMSETETDNNNFVTGYVVTDVNGDGLVDGSDMSIVETNNNNFVSMEKP